MALDINYTLVPGAGNYFVAPTGTAFPADLTTPAAPWASIGHTSLEDILDLTFEGGEKTVLGTLQAKSARTTYSPTSEEFAVVLQQFDAASLALYFGSNMVSINGGELLGIPQSPEPTEVAFLAAFYDGSRVFAFYAPRVEILRGDDPDFGDAENFAGLPLAVTPLIYDTNTWAYAVTPLDYVAP